jgi:hypothetical protein
VKNLAHSASFDSELKDAPSKPGIKHLASDASRFMNGHNLVLDGGITSGRPASVMLAERARFAERLAASA